MSAPCAIFWSLCCPVQSLCENFNLFQIFNSIYQRKEEYKIISSKSDKKVKDRTLQDKIKKLGIQFLINFGISSIHIFLIRYDTELLFLETCDSYVLKLKKFQKETVVSSIVTYDP